MPISTPGSGNAEQAEESAERHHERKRHGQEPDRGRAELRAPQSDRDHREHVIEPRHRVQESGEETGRLPRAARGRAPATPRTRGRRRRCNRIARNSHQPPSTISTIRWIVQNAPSEPTTYAGSSSARRDQWTSSTRKCTRHEQDQRDECELADLDADVEHEERERNILLRESDRREPAREAESVEEAERERDDPRVANREARFAAPRADDLGTEEQDRQRDRGVEGRRRHRGVAERRDRERDAVRERERGDRLHEHPRRAHDQEQTEHEQQVVDAQQDVLDALERGTSPPSPPGRAPRRSRPTAVRGAPRASTRRRSTSRSGPARR